MINEKMSPMPTAEEGLIKIISQMQVEIKDLFQRYGHALDRIIALENKEVRE